MEKWDLTMEGIEVMHFEVIFYGLIDGELDNN